MNHSDSEPVQVQRHLQLRIEAQGKYLQSVLEKAQDTLGRQNLGMVGLEAAKVQLSELVSKVSSQCLNSAFSELKELQGFCPQQTTQTQTQTQTNNQQPNDCSMDSCLTSCDRSQKEQEIQNGGGINIGLRHFNGHHVFMEQRKEQQQQQQATEAPDQVLKWCGEVKKNSTFLTPLGKNNEERSGYGVECSPCSNLSMTIGSLERDQKENNGIAMYPERGVITERHDSDGEFLQHRNTTCRTEITTMKQVDDNRLPSNYFAASRLDLNTRGDNEAAAATSCKQLDLNRFSWN